MPFDDMIRILRDTRIMVGLFSAIVIFCSFIGIYQFWRIVDTDEEFDMELGGTYLIRDGRDSIPSRVWLTLYETKAGISNRDTQWVVHSSKGEKKVAEFRMIARSTVLPISRGEAKKVVLVWSAFLAVFVAPIVWMLLQFYQAMVEGAWGAEAGILVGKRFKMMAAGMLVLLLIYWFLLFQRPRIVEILLGYKGIESDLRFINHLTDTSICLISALLFWIIGEAYQNSANAGGKSDDE